MTQTLRLLIVEDMEDDVLLLLLELQKGGVDPYHERVETVEELKDALKSGRWDAIFADYSLPSFTGLDALRIVHETGIDLPFIIVSGAIGEEQAIEALKAGAHDLILKGQYARLVPALERALKDAALRHERNQSAEELSRHREHLEELVQERTEELAAANEEMQMQSEELQAQNEELQAQSDVLISTLDELRQMEKSLMTAYDELEKRVEERTAELREKDQMLLLQSRQAAMGEMIGNIAHQWRQPLNALGLTIQQLPQLYELGGFTGELLKNNVNRSMELIQHMSKTIDDFRNYFSPDKEKTEFKVHDVIVKTLSLLEGSFQHPRIGIELVAKDNPVIVGYQNEFAQVIINIMNNARDVLIERESDDPRVTITTSSEGGCAVVTIADNAGGIPEEIIGRVFDPYFTTKGPQAGTGVGLFMSKTIIEKNMGGSLDVRNSAEGAEFRIEVCSGSQD